MENSNLYAAVTGDIVGSSRFRESQREDLLLVLKSSFHVVRKIMPDIIYAPFEVFRGDSFQGVLSKPEKALHVAIVIRANLRCHFHTKRRRSAVDARMVVGIGPVDFIPARRVAEGDGEAFRRSGPTLDEMKRWKEDRRLLIRTPWKEIDAELDTECALLDALIIRWSSTQARAILDQFRGLTQEEAGEKYGISQSGVSQLLKDAGGWAIERLCNRYEQVIDAAKKHKHLHEIEQW